METNKLAIITGASSGIGEATAKKLAANGYNVFLIARSAEKLQKIASEIGKNAFFEVLDASDGHRVLDVSKKILDTHGTPDVIINSAGMGNWKRIEDTPPDEARELMNAPFFAAYNMTHAFIPAMLSADRGLLIYIGSPVAIFTWPSCVGYAASRWAMRGMHEALCDDLYKTNISSCQIIFGKVDSPYFSHNPDAEDKIPGISKTIPVLTPEKCAELIFKTIKHPKRIKIYPFMLRMYYWNYQLFPWLNRWLLRRTSIVSCRLD